VLDRFATSVYFDPPNQEVVSKILEHEKIPNAAEVAKRLIEGIGGRGRISGRSLARALEIASALRASNPEFDQGTTAERILLPFLTSQSAENVEQYERRNAHRIAQSNSFLGHWKQNKD